MERGAERRRVLADETAASAPADDMDGDVQVWPAEGGPDVVQVWPRLVLDTGAEVDDLRVWPEQLAPYVEDPAPWLALSGEVYRRCALSRVAGRVGSDDFPAELAKAWLWLRTVLAEAGEGAWVAGGFPAALVSGRVPGDASDVDVFFQSSEAFARCFNRMVTGRWFQEYPVASLSTLAKAAGTDQVAAVGLWLNDAPVEVQTWPVHLVKTLWYPSPEAVLDNFDLTAVQVATDGESLWYARRALHDGWHKLLVAHAKGAARTPAHTAARCRKYMTRGYRLTPALASLLALLPPEEGASDHDGPDEGVGEY